jgi:hypothetical protein
MSEPPRDSVETETTPWAKMLAAWQSDPGRTRQSVTPKLRRAVLERDGGKCLVPGCGNHRFLDVHHLTFQSRGGAHTMSNLGTACGLHHALLHRGGLRVEGTIETGLRFFAADGTPYGAMGVPRSPQVNAPSNDRNDAARALASLGFQRHEVSSLLQTAEQEVGLGAPVDKIVRAALVAHGRALRPVTVADRPTGATGAYAWGVEAIAVSAACTGKAA